MSRVNWNRRVWLNEKNCEATGSVVTFDGKVQRHQGRIQDTSFVEISDCTTKVCIHKLLNQTEEEFVDKLKKLATEINVFAEYLESKHAENKRREAQLENS